MLLVVYNQEPGEDFPCFHAHLGGCLELCYLFRPRPMLLFCYCSKKYNHHAMYLLQNNNMNGNHSPHCHVWHQLQPSPRRPLTHCAPALPAISKGLHLNSRELHTYACSSISQQKRPAHASQLTFTRPSWRVSVSGCMVLHFNHHLAWQDPIPTVIIISSSLLFPRPKVVSEAVHVVMPV